MERPVALEGGHRIETVRDDAHVYHVRASPLTDHSLLGYLLTCLVLAVSLAYIGTDLAYRPRASWLPLLVTPFAFLMLLRRSTDLVVDGYSAIVHVRERRLGFIERATTVPFADLGSIDVRFEGTTGRVVLETATGTITVAQGIPAGMARRLGDRLGSLSSRPVTCPAPDGAAAVVTASAEAAAPPSLEPPPGLHVREDAAGLLVEYPTRSPSTAFWLLLCCVIVAPLAAFYLYGALKILGDGPLSFSKVMLPTVPIALLGLCSMFTGSALSLLVGRERVECDDALLVRTTLIAGRRVRRLELPLEELREIRVDGSIKILQGDSAHRLGGTLDPAQAEWLCGRLRERWQRVVPAGHDQHAGLTV